MPYAICPIHTLTLALADLGFLVTLDLYSGSLHIDVDYGAMVEDSRLSELSKLTPTIGQKKP
jgi:hypothetical protein